MCPRRKDRVRARLKERERERMRAISALQISRVVCSVDGREERTRTIGSFLAFLSLPGVFFLNECGKRVCTQSLASNTRAEPYQGYSEIRITNPAFISDFVQIVVGRVSSDSAICLGIAEFTLYSLLRGQDPARKHTGLSSRKFTTALRPGRNIKLRF